MPHTAAHPSRRTPALPSPAMLGSVAGAAVVAYVFVWWLGLVLGDRPPLPARIQADHVTGMASLLADLTGRLAALVTLGSVLARLVHRRDERLVRVAGRAAQVWFAAALLNTVTNPAYVNGVPMGTVLTPASWWTFLGATPSALAWLSNAFVALGIVLVSYTRRDTGALALGFAAGVLSQLFVAVTGNVTVGLNHDWATDATVVLTLAFVPLATGAFAALVAGTPEAVARHHRSVPALVALTGAGLLVVAWQQLAGQRLTDHLYGLGIGGLFVVLGALLVSWLVRQLTGELDATRPARALWSVTRDVVLVVLALGFAAAENHIPTPRFLEPQNIQINYLGYEVAVAPTLERLLGLGRPNLLWVVLGLAAVGWYLWGMRRARLRGVRWPLGRLVAWCAAWLLFAYLALSGLWEYSTVMYSWHMVVHMTVNMLVPVLAVLGAPLSLAHAAAGPDPAPTSPGGLLVAIEQNRAWQLATSPPVAWLAYVGSLFLVYFTPLFPWLMRYHWAHQLMLLFFATTGYLFFNLIIGHDKTAWEVPHLIKLALVISIMPFHAMFAVGILSSGALIGADFYQTLAMPWLPDLMADQSTAGQATWILGEVPLFIVLVSLAAQWFRSDTADAERIDTAADAGEDDSFDAYNDMLAELARRDAGERRAAALRPPER